MKQIHKRFRTIGMILLCGCTMFGQSVERQKVLEYEPDGCIWHLDIEQVSKKEFTKAYKNRLPYNGQVCSITDTQLNKELVKCAAQVYKAYFTGVEDDDIENTHSYSLKQPNGNILYAVQFTDPIRSFSPLSVFLYHEKEDWVCDSLFAEYEKTAFSNNGILAGAPGFDCDAYALIHFYKMLDTPSGKRMHRIVSYSNLESKNEDNLDATWIIDTEENASMFWAETPNTLYVQGYTSTMLRPVFFRITLYKSKPDNLEIEENPYQ